MKLAEDDQIAAAVDDLLELVDGGGPDRGWQLQALAGAVAGHDDIGTMNGGNTSV